MALRELGPVPWGVRAYQRKAINAVALAWQEKQRTMLVMATGTGKTTVFAEVARRRYLAARGRTLVLAHRIELVKQAAARMRVAGLGAHLENGDNRAPLHEFEVMEPADVVCATVQTLKGRRLTRWPNDAFGQIIIDEAHHATSATYRAILDHFPNALVLGVTATPDRDDGVALGNVIDHLAFSYDLRDGISDGYLSPIKILGIDVNVDLSKVRTTKQEQGRDYSADDLGEQMDNDKILHELAVPIAKESGGRPTIVFTPTVAVAHNLARVLAAYVGDTKVDSLDGSADADTRKKCLERYQGGQTQILVNCALFTEGFDAPHTRCVAIARPTKSRALYAQMVGRGTRVYGAWEEYNEPETPELRRAAIAAGAKPECLILDMAPMNARHTLVTPVDLLVGKDLTIDDDIMKEARARMSRDDVMDIVNRAEEISQARARERSRERKSATEKREVEYKRRERDPFEELGVDGEFGSERGPRATQAQVDALKRAGFSIPKMPSRAEAARALDAVAARREANLCTLKQMRVLERNSLRKDLTFEQASEAMQMLKDNDWRVSSELSEKYGVQEAAEVGNDVDAC